MNENMPKNNLVESIVFIGFMLLAVYGAYSIICSSLHNLFENKDKKIDRETVSNIAWCEIQKYDFMKNKKMMSTTMTVVLPNCAGE